MKILSFEYGSPALCYTQNKEKENDLFFNKAICALGHILAGITRVKTSAVTQVYADEFIQMEWDRWMKRLLCRRAARITNWVFYLHFLCACNQKAVVFKFPNCFLAGINLFQSPEPTVFFLQHHSVYVIKSKNKLSNVYPTVGLTVNLMALKRCLILNC